MMCDPYFLDIKNPESFLKGPYSHIRRCLYNKDTFQYTFEFAQNFWQTYKNEPKLLDINLLDAHESLGDNISTVDEAIVTFLDSVMDSDTMIMLYSDHG